MCSLRDEPQTLQCRHFTTPVYEGSRTVLIACMPAQVDMLEDPKTVLERASRTDALRANLKRIEE